MTKHSGVSGSGGDEGNLANLGLFAKLPCLLGLSCPQLERVFLLEKKQTASPSKKDYLAQLIPRVCSAFYRFFLKDWRQAQIVIKVGFKYFSVS